MDITDYKLLKKVFPANEAVQEETTFKIKKAKELIGKLLME